MRLNFKIGIIITLLFVGVSYQLEGKTKFKVLILTERGGQHEGFVVAALAWISDFSKVQNFEYKVVNHPSEIDELQLSDYQLFIQLNYPPYNWTTKSEESFKKYIDEGQGGWIGFHHATLLGEFDGFPLWSWFSDFMGGIRFKDYVAAKASGKVVVEKSTHPVMKNLPASFIIPDDEWYTFDKNPRPNVTILAHVDEESYTPPTTVKMGDHPVIWTNPSKKARNAYFLMGHSAQLFESKEFKQLFANAIKWAAAK